MTAYFYLSVETLHMSVYTNVEGLEVGQAHVKLDLSKDSYFNHMSYHLNECAINSHCYPLICI